MGATDQPRDTWGRWTARPGGRASAPSRPTHAALYTQGSRTVYLTKERTPHYQVWDGETLVAEKPVSRSWRRDQDEAVALATGAPRDTSNLVQLPAASYHAVINNVLRGARAQTPLPAGLKLRSKGEQELSTLIAEHLRRDNPSRPLEEIRTEADQRAAVHAANRTVSDALAQQRVVQHEAEQDDEDAARESERYA